MSNLIERLKEAQSDSQQRCLGSNIFQEAADTIEQQQSLIEEFVKASKAVIEFQSIGNLALLNRAIERAKSMQGAG
jgi:hypothetical protein